MKIEIIIDSQKSGKINLSEIKEKILDDLITDISIKLERQFNFYIKGSESNTFLVEDFFISPPSKGELYNVKDKYYKVLEVIHFNSHRKPNSILVEEITFIN